jgi:Probable cobalt transporter subunit (CbtB)
MTLSQARPGERPAAIAVPVWAWVLVAYGIVILFVVLQDNGLAFVLSADRLHDFFHDARHSLGVPCH